MIYTKNRINRAATIKSFSLFIALSLCLFKISDIINRITGYKGKQTKVSILKDIIEKEMQARQQKYYIVNIYNNGTRELCFYYKDWAMDAIMKFRIVKQIPEAEEIPQQPRR